MKNRARKLRLQESRPLHDGRHVVGPQARLGARQFGNRPRAAHVIIVRVRIEDASDRGRVEAKTADGVQHEVNRLRVAGVNQQQPCPRIDEVRGDRTVTAADLSVD